jgi:NAD(P)-dependent dehydrogenase (short-subunit alcohol dehydrogenase family)
MPKYPPMDITTRTPRVVAVTGASSGIGLAVALEAADRGDHLALLARGRESLEVAAEQCRRRGAASVTVWPADVADDDAVRTAFAGIDATLGPVDLVVHAAGVVAYGRFEAVPVEVFDRVVRTNLLGAANVARAVLPGLRDRDAGALVLVGSLLGFIAPPYMSAYATSKWGLRGLARILEVENRDRPGVHISHLSPGGIDTPIYRQAGNYLGWVGRPPPPVASPEQVARAALRLADRPRARRQVGPLNLPTIWGFTLLPRGYDRIVTGLFEVAATDVREPARSPEGNVFTSAPAGNRLRGGQGSPWVSILAGLRARLAHRFRATP